MNKDSIGALSESACAHPHKSLTGTNKAPGMYSLRETLIKRLATVCTADLPHSTGKNAQNTTSIPVLFACTMQQIHRYNQ
jgi:hypothetical protein